MGAPRLIEYVSGRPRVIAGPASRQSSYQAALVPSRQVRKLPGRGCPREARSRRRMVLGVRSAPLRYRGKILFIRNGPSPSSFPVHSSGASHVSKIVVITGAGAGVGRATVTEFAREGCDVALLSRDLNGSRPPRKRRAPSGSARCRSPPTSPMRRRWSGRGPGGANSGRSNWVNVAMATVFAPVAKLTPERSSAAQR